MSSSDIGFYSRYVRNGVTLCKLDFNVKNRTAVAGSVNFIKYEQKLFNGKKCCFIASFFLKIKCGKSKDMQERVSIMGVRCG